MFKNRSLAISFSAVSLLVSSAFAEEVFHEDIVAAEEHSVVSQKERGLLDLLKEVPVSQEVSQVDQVEIQEQQDGVSEEKSKRIAESFGWSFSDHTSQLEVPARGELVSLLIGINYQDTESELSNCILDIDHVLENVLKPQLGLTDNHLIYMSDNQAGTPYYPSRLNILDQLNQFSKLINISKNGYFHYSGHGSRIEDYSGDERDNYDEALVPIDYDRSGLILDDELFERFVDRLVPDVNLLVISDCCHSGTIMDLPYKWNSNGHMTVEYKFTQQQLNRLPHIVMLSGCRDSQTSEDGGPITVNGEGSGALTGAFLKVLKEHDYQITYRELLLEVNDLLKREGFKQRPQLTSTRLLDLDDIYMAPVKARAVVNN